jgi:hypothetical protein
VATWHAPGFGRTLAHLALNVLSRRIGGPTRLKGHTTTSGDRCKAHGIGVSHFGMDLFEENPQGFGKLLRD